MKRCLVVDDSRIIRRVASKIVYELGFEPEEAEDGKKALEASRVHMPDIAIVDWDMPNMDGLSFVQELRKMPGGDKPIVIFCTAENEVHHIERALDTGANEYIMKPFDSEIVRSKLTILGALD
ncbi:MAG: response regulator [Rhodospirillaceae bacterium]|nr:response regulator [Rhodospirillaceae bacterium]